MALSTSDLEEGVPLVTAENPSDFVVLPHVTAADRTSVGSTSDLEEGMPLVTVEDLSDFVVLPHMTRADTATDGSTSDLEEGMPLVTVENALDRVVVPHMTPSDTATVGNTSDLDEVMPLVTVEDTSDLVVLPHMTPADNGQRLTVPLSAGVSNYTLGTDRTLRENLNNSPRSATHGSSTSELATATAPFAVESTALPNTVEHTGTSNSTQECTHIA